MGFLDGTSLGYVQGLQGTKAKIYSGYKRMQGLKFQAMAAPNSGLILDLFGCFFGRLSDSHTLNKPPSFLSRIEILRVPKNALYVMCVYVLPLRMQCPCMC